MTDRQSLLNGIARSDSVANIPVSGTLSPYLNVNPALVQGVDSQYILPEGASHKRGRFELSFGIIGSSVMLGGSLFGVKGLLFERKLLRESLSSQNKVARTKLLNSLGKHTYPGAQQFGVAAVLYSGTSVLMSRLRPADDHANTLLSGAAAGVLYCGISSIREGMKKAATRSGVGALGGVGITTAYCLLTDRERFLQMFSW